MSLFRIQTHHRSTRALSGDIFGEGEAEDDLERYRSARVLLHFCIESADTRGFVFVWIGDDLLLVI